MKLSFNSDFKIRDTLFSVAVPILFISYLYIAIFIASGAIAESGSSGIVMDMSISGLTRKETGWNEISARHFKVYLQDGVDIDIVERRLKKRVFFPAHGVSYDSEAGGGVSYALDLLFNRVRDMLDMHPAMPKLKVRIFKTRDDLNKEYLKLIGKSGDIKAFYVQAKGTIYSSEDTITDSVIAHEIAHAVIDYYFMMIPSKKVAEVLASYVDLHLSD